MPGQSPGLPSGTVRGALTQMWDVEVVVLPSFCHTPTPQESSVYRAEFSLSLQISEGIFRLQFYEGKDSLVGTWELKAEKDINRAST